MTAMLEAPIDGVVIFNDAAASAAAAAAGGAGTAGKLGEGSAVSPASAPFTVVDLDALKFTAEVDEADIDRVKVGMNAESRSTRSRARRSRRRSSDSTRWPRRPRPAAPSSRSRCVARGHRKDILIGMKGDATIKVSSQQGALTIPVEALFSEGGTDYVYVVDGTTLKKTEITVGATTDTDVEVLERARRG